MRLSKSEIKQEIEKGMSPYMDALKSANTLIQPTQAQDALSKAAQPVPNQIKANLLKVVDKSENLANSFKIYRGKKNTAVYKIYIGPDYSKGGGGQLAHLIEYGTVQRERRSISEDGRVKIVSTGMMPARPFMRPAWEQLKDKVTHDAQLLCKNIIENSLKQKGFKK